MTRLTEEVLSAALKQTVPEPDADPNRASRARMQAHRMRTRRRVAASAAAVVGALVIGLPAVVSMMHGRSVEGSAGGPATSGWTAASPPCVNDACGPAAVISAIRHPLQLASVSAGKGCPVSPVRRFPGGAGFSGPFAAIGSGPFYLASSPTVPVSPTHGPWLQQKVIWVVDRSYSGPLLLRGHRIDGAGELKFPRYIGAVGYNDGPWYGKHRELAYVRSGLTAHVEPTLDSFPSGIYVESPGCYAIQVDGVGFSEILVFRTALSD